MIFKKRNIWERIMNFLKRNFKSLFFISLFILLIYFSADSEIGSDYQINGNQHQISDIQFPRYLENPKNITFNWNYKGKNYSIEYILYENIYNYYKNHQVKIFYEGISEDNYYENLFSNIQSEDDKTIVDIVNIIRLKAEESNLSEDETLELIISFVQSIPYDDIKYNIIQNSLETEKTWPRLPYEVLYDNKGICTGKSLLAIALIKEVGYGVALFGSDKVEHVVPAVKCTPEYSFHSSGYCYTEVTTTGFRIGDSNVDDIESGKATTKSSLEYENNSFGEIDNDYFSDFKIYNQKDGKIYNAIIETVKIAEKIKDLEDQIYSMESKLENLKNKYLDLEYSVDYYEREANKAYEKHLIYQDDYSYNVYLEMQNQYEDIYYQYKNQLDSHNYKIEEYNDLINEYNNLIEIFYN